MGVHYTFTDHKKNTHLHIYWVYLLTFFGFVPICWFYPNHVAMYPYQSTIFNSISHTSYSWTINKMGHQLYPN